jgi:hypothetical protein
LCTHLKLDLCLIEPQSFFELIRNHSRSSRPLMSTAPSKPDAPGRTRHAALRAPARFSASTRHVACASACRVHPCADQTCSDSRCRPLLSCPPSFPHPLPTASDICAATFCTTAARPHAAALQRDRLFATTNAPASRPAPGPNRYSFAAHRAATVGPKYRLSNDAGLVVLRSINSPFTSRRHCSQPVKGRPRESMGRRRPNSVPSTSSASPVLHTCWPATAPTCFRIGTPTGR